MLRPFYIKVQIKNRLTFIEFTLHVDSECHCFANAHGKPPTTNKGTRMATVNFACDDEYRPTLSVTLFNPANPEIKRRVNAIVNPGAEIVALTQTLARRTGIRATPP